MAKKHDLIIQIDAYLRGQLTENDKNALEQTIATDPLVAQQLVQQKQHLEALDILLADDLTVKMNAWEAEIEAKQAPKKTGKFWILGFLSFILGGSILAIVLKNKKDTVSIPSQKASKSDTVLIEQKKAPKSILDTPQPSDSLPKNNLSPRKSQNPKPPISPSPPIAENAIWLKSFLDSSKVDLVFQVQEMEKDAANRSEKIDSILAEIYSLFPIKNYNKVIDLLKNEQNTEGGYLLAIAYFLKGDYDKAQDFFGALAKNTGFIKAETAEYYAALCALGKGQNTEAVALFKKMALDKEHPFSRKAQGVLLKLE
jgi:tetratricopeptide (TPR) repeat protein